MGPSDVCPRPMRSLNRHHRGGTVLNTAPMKLLPATCLRWRYRHHVNLTALLCMASLIPLAEARADTYEESNDALQSVVVTATRVPTPEIQVASSVTVVTAEEIAARQIQTAPDLLKEIPGLNVVQSGGPGGQTSVFMRGTNSNHTKVLVDGIDVSDPSTPNGSFDFGQFLVQDIERIEVLRGPQSGLYGSDAIGGVINI